MILVLAGQLRDASSCHPETAGERESVLTSAKSIVGPRILNLQHIECRSEKKWVRIH